MESLSQNPEFTINPENLHACKHLHFSIQASKMEHFFFDN